MGSVQEMVKKFDTGTAPLMKRMPEIAQDLQTTLERTSHLISSADTAYGGDSQVKRDLDRLLVEISDTSRSVRLLADFLSAHPEALVQGRSGKAVER